MFSNTNLGFLLSLLLHESLSFLPFSSSGKFQAGQRRGTPSREPSVDPFMIRNAIYTGNLLANVGKQELRELNDLAGPVGGGSNGHESFNTPFVGIDVDTGLGENPDSDIPTLANNAFSTGMMLVGLGKQELHELNDLAGVQTRGDLLFNTERSNNVPSVGLKLGYDFNSHVPSIKAPTGGQKSSSIHIEPPILNLKVSASFNSDNENNNELVDQHESHSSADLTSQIAAPQSQQPPFKGTFNPLVDDAFHASFSILTPTIGTKIQKDPIFYPIQFYSPEALQFASLQQPSEETTSDFQSNHDNFDAW